MPRDGQVIGRLDKATSLGFRQGTVDALDESAWKILTCLPFGEHHSLDLADVAQEILQLGRLGRQQR